MERRSSRPCRLWQAGISLRFALGVVLVAGLHAGAAAAGDPARAFWVSPSATVSRDAIRRAVASAVSDGFEAMIVPISARSVDSQFDGEAELLRQARASGLATYLSIAVTVGASVGEFPPSREHVIYQHPEWLMVPRELAPELLELDPKSPAYLGRIARWTRANAERVDGLHVSPLDPAAVSYLADGVVAAVKRYAVDGVYLDALDLPGQDFDYSRHATEVFRTSMRATLSPVERARLDAIEGIDPFAYAIEFPSQWRQFRESALTQLMTRVRATLRSARPTLSITVGARSDADISRRDHFQDWRTWLTRGIVDRIGHRSRATGTVLLSTDAGIPSDSSPEPGPQSAGIGGPR